MIVIMCCNIVLPHCSFCLTLLIFLIMSLYFYTSRVIIILNASDTTCSTDQVNQSTVVSKLLCHTNDTKEEFENVVDNLDGDSHFTHWFLPLFVCTWMFLFCNFVPEYYFQQKIETDESKRVILGEKFRCAGLYNVMQEP